MLSRGSGDVRIFTVVLTLWMILTIPSWRVWWLLLETCCNTSTVERELQVVEVVVVGTAVATIVVRLCLEWEDACTVVGALLAQEETMMTAKVGETDG